MWYVFQKYATPWDPECKTVGRGGEFFLKGRKYEQIILDNEATRKLLQEKLGQQMRPQDRQYIDRPVQYNYNTHTHTHTPIYMIG